MREERIEKIDIKNKMLATVYGGVKGVVGED